MKIGHVGPFAPHRCGLYEASRDMMKADILSGHEAIYVDTGIEGKDGKIGEIDERSNFKLETVSPIELNNCDIIIMHNDCHDSWLVQNTSPLIWVVHGRPLACWRPNNGSSYDMYIEKSRWTRTKKMLYFWPEFFPHWQSFFHNKDLVLHSPPIDQSIYNSTGDKYEFQSKGDINFLIADADRQDVGLYELIVGCLEVSKKYKNVKFHFFGLDFPLKNCWNIILGKLKELGTLGDICGRILNLEQVYRASDCLISPNRICTRTIAEAISCNIPVISQNNNRFADYCCDMSNTNDFISAIDLFLADFKNKRHKDTVLERSKLFSLDLYSKLMRPIYEEVIK